MVLPVALLFLLGWLGTSHFLPWVSWHAEVPFFAATLLIAWVLILSKRHGGDRVYVVLPAPAWPFLVLLVAGAMQALTGKLSFLGDAIVFGLYAMLCIVSLSIGYLSRCLTRDSSAPYAEYESLAWLAKIVLCGAIFSVMISLAQAFEVWESSSWILRQTLPRRPGGNLGQPNHLATLLVMAIASAAYLLFLRRISVILFLVLTFVLYGGLAITESRTGALSLLALMIWWTWKQSLVSPKFSRWYAAGMIAVFVSMFLGWPVLFGVYHGDAEALVRMGVHAGNVRMDVWPQLLEAALQEPWFGWGVLQTAAAHNSVAHSYLKGESFSYSHNLLLDSVLWVGFPLSVVLIAMVGIWSLRRARMARSLVPWYGIAVALPLGVHSMLEFPFAYAYLLVPAMFSLGAMEYSLGCASRLRIHRRSAIGVLMAVTVLASWATIEYLRAEDDFRVMRFETLHIGKTPDDYERPKIVLQSQLAALMESMRVEIGPNMPAAELQLMEKVALRYPWTATRYRYALCLALNGRAEDASRQMRVIQVLHGQRAFARLNRQLHKQLARIKPESDEGLSSSKDGT